MGGMPGTGAGTVVGKNRDQEQIETLRTELGALQSLLRGTLTVNVANADEIRPAKGAVTDPSGRDGEV